MITGRNSKWPVYSVIAMSQVNYRMNHRNQFGQDEYVVCLWRTSAERSARGVCGNGLFCERTP